MAKDVIKKAKNGTYYFRENLGIILSLVSKFKKKLKKKLVKNIPDYYSRSRRIQKKVRE